MTSCDPDPTDDAHYSHITFVNDTSTPLALYECGDDKGHDCHDMAGGPLKPGERMDQRQWWGPGLADWQVRDPQGQSIGWLLVASPVRESGAVYLFSDAVANPSRAASPHGSPQPDPMPD